MSRECKKTKAYGIAQNKAMGEEMVSDFYLSKFDFMDNYMNVWCYGFRQGHYTEDRLNLHDCEIKDSPVNPEDITLEWIKETVKRREDPGIFDTLKREAKEFLSERAGYDVGDKAIEWHIVNKFKGVLERGISTGKSISLDQL